MSELDNNLVKAEEVDLVEYYLGLTPCQDCKRFAVSQIYIHNQTNRQRRVCNRCFVIAWRNNIVLKEEVVEEANVETNKVILS